MKSAAPALAALALVALAGGCAPRTGAVEGRLRYEGPERDRRVRVTRDQEVCAPAGTLLEEGSLRVDAEGGLSGAVVWARRAAPAAPSEHRLTNVGCLFEPRVLVAQVGDRLAVESRDAVLHSTRIQREGRTLFNLTLPEPGARLVKPLEEPGLLQVGCDAHAWMRAWIRVLPEGAGAVTDAEGRFRIEGLPPGEQELEIWHERLGTQVLRVTVPAGGAASVEPTW